jgi:mitogen-activated protein kinase organizer 1
MAPLKLFCRFRGHANSEYKVDCGLTVNDQYVVSGSEDGRVCFWDLVSVCKVSTQAQQLERM